MEEKTKTAEIAEKPVKPKSVEKETVPEGAATKTTEKKPVKPKSVEKETVPEDAMVVYVHVRENVRNVKISGRKTSEQVADGFRVGVILGSHNRHDEGMFKLGNDKIKDNSRLEYEAFGQLKAVEFGIDKIGLLGLEGIKRIIVKTECPIESPEALTGTNASRFLWVAHNKQASPAGLKLEFVRVTPNQNPARAVSEKEDMSIYYTSAQRQDYKDTKGTTRSPQRPGPVNQFKREPVQPENETENEVVKLRREVNGLTNQVVQLTSVVEELRELFIGRNREQL